MLNVQNVKAENDAIGVLLSSFSPNPIRKSTSSVYANICEVNYGQSKADMLSKFEIALKECSETEGCYGYYSIQVTLTKKLIKSIEIFVGE